MPHITRILLLIKKYNKKKKFNSLFPTSPFYFTSKRLPIEYLHVQRAVRLGSGKAQAIFNLRGTLIIVGLKASGHEF
jgi:hypothetical protein